MTNQAEPDSTNEVDEPHLAAAIEEEQGRLQQHIQEVVREAQAQYLINRCIELNAQMRALSADGTPDGDEDPA